MKNRPPRRYCRRRKMVVSFAQLNMTDWILAPVTFDAGVCAGACTFPLGQETLPTNHAVLQSVWSRFLQTSTATSIGASGASVQRVPPPCCAPHELEALPMLYFQTDNRVVLNHRPDMVVRSCGCKWWVDPPPPSPLHISPYHWCCLGCWCFPFSPNRSFLHFEFYELFDGLFGLKVQGRYEVKKCEWVYSAGIHEQEQRWSACI